MPKYLFYFASLVLFLTPLLHADTVSIHITVDEYGVGTFTNNLDLNAVLTGSLQHDPGPGGLDNVLTYGLRGAPVVAGDVLLSEPSGAIFDVVRFNSSNGTLAFYSDNLPTADSPGDTPSPPLTLYGNLVIIPEIGPEGNNLATYTPTAGQPGFMGGASGPVTYTLISDGHTPNVVPEPGTVSLLSTGVLGLLCVARRKLYV
jgi:hypothetical protein